MESEDSSDDEGFVPVVGGKRQKLAGADADGGKVVENLLRNNKFGPLAGGNNNDDADQAGGGGAPAVQAPSKSTNKCKQPPLVVTNLRFARLLDVMALCNVKPEYRLARSGIKVTCFSVEDYDTVQALLLKYKVQFYSHERKKERPHRFVLRGLPDWVPVEDVKHRLKVDHNLDVLDVKAIKRKGESIVEESPYIVFFPKGHTNLKKLSAVRTVKLTSVRWEAYRNKQPNVTQCRNCLRLGHGARNCHRNGRCNKCGKSHKTDQCKNEETQAKRCANCSGEHEALDRSCPKRAEFILARQQATKPKPSAEKAKKPRPPVPPLSPEEFPPLPGMVPGQQNPQPGGSEGGTGPGAGGNTKDKADAKGGQKGNGTRGGAKPKADEEEVLYTWEEVWKISLEYSARLRNCSTRSEQLDVICYMNKTYGSKK